MDEYEALVHDGKRKIVLTQKPVPLQLCPPQIPQLPAWVERGNLQGEAIE
jgi:hypothetical protein